MEMAMEQGVGNETATQEIAQFFKKDQIVG